MESHKPGAILSDTTDIEYLGDAEARRIQRDGPGVVPGLVQHKRGSTVRDIFETEVPYWRKVNVNKPQARQKRWADLSAQIMAGQIHIPITDIHDEIKDFNR